MIVSNSFPKNECLNISSMNQSICLCRDNELYANVTANLLKYLAIYFATVFVELISPWEGIVVGAREQVARIACQVWTHKMNKS